MNDIKNETENGEKKRKNNRNHHRLNSTATKAAALTVNGN